MVILAHLHMLVITIRIDSKCLFQLTVSLLSNNRRRDRLHSYLMGLLFFIHYDMKFASKPTVKSMIYRILTAV